MTRPTATDTSRRLIDELIRELRDLKDLSPSEKIKALAPYVDRASGTHIEARISEIRRAAVVAAVAAAGSQAALAREIGVSQQLISELVRRKAGAVGG
jgi:hypothetical protein